MRSPLIYIYRTSSQTNFQFEYVMAFVKDFESLLLIDITEIHTLRAASSLSLVGCGNANLGRVQM